MNLLNFRDRVRLKAIEAGLSYSEIEGLTDVNELLNQTMPCLLFNYEQEQNDYTQPHTVVTPRIYLITTIFDAELTESGTYQRDWIINKKNELRAKYIDWLQRMPFDGSPYLEVISDNQLQIQTRVSVEGFLIMEALPTLHVSREFCLEGSAPPSPIGCLLNIDFTCNDEIIQSVEDLNPCEDNTIVLTSPCHAPNPAVFLINDTEVGTAFNGNPFTLNVVDGDGDQVGSLIGANWVVPSPPAQSTDCRVITTGQNDGSNERSRNNGNFFLLAYTNVFGHNRRFTGTTGGYHDGTNYRNFDGTISNFATAFPNQIVLDWNDRSGTETTGTVKAWYIFSSPLVQWQNAIDAVALLTVGGFTWYLPMIDEFNFISLKSIIRCFNWLPFGEFLSGTQTFWTLTENANNTVQAYRYDSTPPHMNVQNKTGGANRGYIAVTQLLYNGTTITQ
jgi:hypothetical protein